MLVIIPAREMYFKLHILGVRVPSVFQRSKNSTSTLSKASSKLEIKKSETQTGFNKYENLTPIKSLHEKCRRQLIALKTLFSVNCVITEKLS